MSTKSFLILSNLFIFLFIILFCSYIQAGENPQKRKENFKQEFFSFESLDLAKNKVIFDIPENPNRKSSFLAICLSLVLPGMGELYSNRFDVGKYSVTAEAALWISFIGINTYGNLIKDDGRAFARVHAGFDNSGKDDDYYINVSNFINVYEYNDKKLRDRNSAKVYDPNSNLSWQWDTDENRQKFRDMRVRSDEIINNIKYISVALIANRILSAVNAARFTHQYNNNLEKSASLNFSISPIQSNRVFDGISLNFNVKF